MASVRLAVVGLAIILFVLYRPQGLFGAAGDSSMSKRPGRRGSP